MRYKQSPLWLAMSLLMLLLIFSQGFKTTAAAEVNRKNTAGFAVIELFTSEGCSSCPSADAVVENFLNENTKQVYVLAFHVDYWNKLGWKDVFSNTDYTNRQRKYAAVFKLENIYTPQIVVNGKCEFVGSNSNQLKRVTEKEFTNGEGKTIMLTASSGDSNHIVVNYKLKEKMNANLNIALVQLHASSNVKRGENGGRHLQHINVVRDFTTFAPAELAGSAGLVLPVGITKKDCKVIAYLQDPVSMQITGVTEINIQ